MSSVDTPVSTGRTPVAQAPAVELDGVSVTFDVPGKGQTLVARDISFTAQQGEFIAIVGPSGCGKTTVLNMLAGLLTPSGARCRATASPSRVRPATSDTCWPGRR